MNIKHPLVKGKVKEIKPFVHFDSYLKMGYYPFYKEEKELFNQRLNEVVNMILEIELPLLRNLEIAYIHRIKQLLVILTESVPFTPNITKLSSKIGINRATLLTYLHYLKNSYLIIDPRFLQ
jgi:predicted AAA+ superfamily ATPase